MPPILSGGVLISGRYRLDRHLGDGGMGRVWAATHTVTRRPVAMKFLKESVQHRPDVRHRFLREASAASALRHPNVVEVLDVFDLEDQLPVMVMKLLEGETLGAKLAREERLSVEETAALLLPVIDAVTAAHALGIIHRDLKPENIFVTRGDDPTRVKVLDFGIAKLAAEHYLEAGQSVLETEAGAILGTPCYMAPEQLDGTAVDRHADIWSLGVILYECLSGTRPVEGRNLAEVISRLVGGAITPLDRLAPELPAELTSAVQQMLARDVSRRLSDLADVTKILVRHSRTSFVPSPVRTAEPRGSVPPPAPQSGAASPVHATMLSAPALGIDTASARAAAAASPPKRRRWLFPVVGTAAVCAILLLRWQRSETPGQVAPPAPPSAAQASARDAIPEPRALAELPAPPATSAAVPAPARSAHPAASTRLAGSARSASSSSPSEGILFSGRK